MSKTMSDIQPQYELRWQTIPGDGYNIEIMLYRAVVDVSLPGKAWGGTKEFAWTPEGEIKLHEGVEVPPKAIFKIPIASFPTAEQLSHLIKAERAKTGGSKE